MEHIMLIHLIDTHYQCVVVIVLTLALAKVFYDAPRVMVKIVASFTIINNKHNIIFFNEIFLEWRQLFSLLENFPIWEEPVL
jgi:hypothetical protein